MKPTDKISKLSDDLQYAFIWKDTPQGHDYWNTVRRNLDLLAKRCPHCNGQLE